MYKTTLAGISTKGIWQGHVHSIFANAINIITPQQRFTLLFNPQWISEHNIIIDNRQILEQINSTSIISADERYLYIDGSARVDRQAGDIWQMPAFKPVLIQQKVMDKLAFFLQSEESKGILQYIDNLFIEKIEQFCKSAPVDFAKLIGVGPGLTPSSDDMLVGFALALWYFCPKWLVELADVCQPFLHNTTDISRYLLQDAFNGQFSAPLVNLLLAMMDDKDFDAALTIAVNVGSSSGRDGVFGLYHGLKVLNKVI